MASSFCKLKLNKLSFVVLAQSCICFLQRDRYGITILKKDERRKKCVVVKLGGSAITKKKQFETIDEKLIDITTAQISDVIRNNKDIDLAIVHGAGSFGHFQAKKYKINIGNQYHKDWVFGFADTRRSVTQLNHDLVSRLVKAQVPALSLSLFPNSKTSNEKLTNQDPSISQVVNVLSQGMVPVFHGDAVFDHLQGCAIVSGDVILEELCQVLQPTSAVFITDVEGVFTKPPNEDPSAKLIKEIVLHQEDGSVSCEMPGMSNAEHDVTGGIAGKLQTAFSIARRFKIPVYIVQVGTEHAKEAMAGRQPKVCTTIRMR